jgi:hypothetical protein
MRRTVQKFTFAIAMSATLLPPPAVQAEASSPVTRGPYDLGKLHGICDYVYSRDRASTGSGYRYTFQRMLADATRAKPGDDVETRRTRLRYLWLDNQPVFGCTASNFDISNGNLLKYSISSRSYEFLNYAIEDWQLELNFIDPADHRTVLDYVEREAKANAGNSDSATIDEYFSALQQAGAKRCVEMIAPLHCTHSYGPERETALRAIAAYNEQVRTAPLRPFQPL